MKRIFGAIQSAPRKLEVSSSADETEILMYDQIGEGFFSYGITAKDVIAALSNASQKPVHVRLNSPGGDVFEGAAIYNALKNYAPGVRVTVDALAASIAAVIAMAGKTIQMADMSMMMIHNPWVVMDGDAAQLRSMADLLDQIKGQQVDMFAEKTGQGKNDVTAMMDAETWFTAEDAVAKGFATELAPSLESGKATGKFNLAMYGYKRVPEKLLAREPEQKPEEKPDTSRISLIQRRIAIAARA